MLGEPVIALPVPVARGVRLERGTETGRYRNRIRRDAVISEVGIVIRHARSSIMYSDELGLHNEQVCSDQLALSVSTG